MRSSTTPLPSFYPLYSPHGFAFPLYSFYLSSAVFLSYILNAPYCPQNSSLMYSPLRFKLHDFSILLPSFYPCLLQRFLFFTTLDLSLFTSMNCPISFTHPHYSQSAPLHRLTALIFYLFSFIYRCYNMLYLKIPSSFNSVLPQFLIHARGSLDYARDDGVFSCRHFD